MVGDNFRNPEKICCKAAPGTVFTIIYKNGNSLDDETIAKIQNNSSPGIVIKKPEITHVGDGERRERGERLVK